MTQFRVHRVSFFSSSLLEGRVFSCEVEIRECWLHLLSPGSFIKGMTEKTTEREVTSKCCWWQKFPFLCTPADGKQPAVPHGQGEGRFRGAAAPPHPTQDPVPTPMHGELGAPEPQGDVSLAARGG